jgi:MarR family transcriptional regulator for hemolysin
MNKPKNINNAKLHLLLCETAKTLRDSLDKRLKPLGLSQAKWRTLLYLSLAKKPLTQAELAANMAIEAATLVGLLDRLAKDGWITREKMPNDRRSKIVQLTEKAYKTLEQIHQTANALRDEILDMISDDEINAGITLLSKIKNKAENIA